ncbi:MAG: rod shape-determining protein MreC [Bacteroidales bacterium]|nr:rod shape-determining protein MreC [Bacteroidales bacterium]
MNKRYGLLLVVANVALFVFLEAAAVFMIANGGIVQRYKITGAVRDIQSTWWGALSDARSYIGLKEVNAALSEENTRLHNRLLLYEAAESELDRIFSETRKTFDYLSATVIMNTTDRQQNFLILNKGSKSGVSEGMGVVTDKGVVGIVEAVTDNYCRVLSFLNASQAVSAKIAKNNYFGPMRWNRKSIGTATMSDVSIHCEVNPGDTITTSGYSSIFPTDIPLGIAVSNNIVNGTYMEIEVDLFQNFKTLRDVYIVINHDLAEIRLLDDTNKKK